MAEALTKSSMTLTLEADGFVGLRQCEEAAQEAARRLRTILPYEVRVLDVAQVFTDASGSYDDVLSGAELPQPDPPAPAQYTPSPPQPNVIPLHVEAERGGLPEANLAEPRDADEAPPAGGESAEQLPTEPTEGMTAWEDMTVAELRDCAAEAGISGRATMTKGQLIEALGEAGA